VLAVGIELGRLASICLLKTKRKGKEGKPGEKNTLSFQTYSQTSKLSSGWPANVTAFFTHKI